MLRSEQQAALDDAIVTCLYAADRYRSAARRAHDRHLSEFFATLAHERTEFAQKLTDALVGIGSLPSQPDPDKETLDEIITRIKMTFAADERSLLLEECKHVEQQIAAAASKAVQNDQQESTRQILECVIDAARRTQERLESF